MNSQLRIYPTLKLATAWHCDETVTKYTNTTSFSRKLLLPLSSSPLAECGLSAVNDLSMKRKNRLYITK